MDAYNEGKVLTLEDLEVADEVNKISCHNRYYVSVPAKQYSMIVRMPITDWVFCSYFDLDGRPYFFYHKDRSLLKYMPSNHRVHLYIDSEDPMLGVEIGESEAYLMDWIMATEKGGGVI